MTRVQTVVRSGADPWLVIGCGCLLAFLSFGPRASLGLFFAPITADNGWSRDVFSLSLALQNLFWGIGQVFIGGVADRYGTLKVFWGGALCYGLGLTLMTVSADPLVFHLGAGALIGLGLAGASFNLVLASFGKLLPEDKRSQAYGFGTAASSMGQFIFAPLSVGLIASAGWQAGLLTFAALLLLVLPLALPLRTPPLGHAPVSGQSSIREALSDAARHPSFVFLVLGFFTCGFQLAFITVHLPPYLRDIGLGPEVGGWTLAMIGLFNIVGSLGAGWLGTRMPKPYLLSAIYLARSLAIIALLVLPPSAMVSMAFGAAMGLLWLSTVPLTAGLIGVMFGTRFMATLYGIAFLSHQVGGFLGVWLGGVLYEATGSYDSIWWGSVALGVASGLINLPIREKPAPQLQRAAA